MNNNEFLINNARVTIEPKQNFHYRYSEEIAKGNSHGVLNGQQGQYPKIELRLPENGDLDECGNKRDFFVLVSLHCSNNNRTLSPHVLLQRCQTKVDYEFIFKKMDVCVSNPMERVWQLKDYVIVRLKISEFKKSFSYKEAAYKSLELPLKFANLLGELNLDNKQDVTDSGELNVRLGFTIFERDFYKNQYSLYRDTIYSCNIYHGDDLAIKKICNTKGNVRGGTEVTILIRYESNLPLGIFIKRIDEDSKETLWSTTAKISETFQNAAITFIMPPYQGPECNKDEILVYLCVKVQNTTYQSEFGKFYYLNERKYKKARLSEHHDQNLEDRENKPMPSPSPCGYVADNATLTKIPIQKDIVCSNKSDIKLKIDNVFKYAKDSNHIFPNELLYSIFYKTLESEDAFKHLYKMANDPSKNFVVADFCNENRENLLHIACQMNQFKRIRPLIGLGCHINEQNQNGRTPLHVALAAQHIDCIVEIQYIFNNISKYPKEVETDLINMIKAYNHDGHTVLHDAILGQHNELVELIMMFMHKHDMNVLDFEVLGSGDSIVHLAVQNNLMSIWPLIEKYVPNYMTVKNYAGIMVQQLESEMLSKLKI